MLHNLKFAGNPPLTPTLEIPCYKAQMLPGMAERLAKVVLQEKDHILATTPNPPWGQSSWLSSRFEHYNLLDYDHEELRYLNLFIKQSYIDYMTAVGLPIEPCYVRAWANAYTFNTNLVWHNHFESHTSATGPLWSHVSGNVCIQTFGTRTWYLSPFLGGVGHNAFGEGYDYPADVIGVENVVGECLFFPSWMVHRTEKNANPNDLRITIAFDIITQQVYQAKTNNALFRQLI